jgi:transcriptional regulator of heat shock response
MHLRSKTILEAAIKEFIRSGEPVSSKELSVKYDFGLKAASVRNELGKLTKDGFLAQLHTSGGRVPTDKGYQFFVEHTLDNIIDAKKILTDKHHLLTANLRRGQLRDFVEEFSDEVKLLGVGKKEKEREVYKSGLRDLFEQGDFGTKEEMSEIVRDFESLDQRLDAMRSRLFKELQAPQVFIGKQSPITKSTHVSVIADSYDLGDDKILIAVIGPKRMDYDKVLKLFKSFRNQLEE